MTFWRFLFLWVITLKAVFIHKNAGWEYLYYDRLNRCGPLLHFLVHVLQLRSPGLSALLHDLVKLLFAARTDDNRGTARFIYLVKRTFLYPQIACIFRRP